ncbi:DMT family transporter [Marivibrio halodurans]|uniref:DMT family transporter n=1 Tax=Marivibrio halodurans TaxID=2039722 RepID=A0A8J7V2J3_9PROT|nr:DMT family transporter [Marivibrio halodurans]MBP5857385.1 DMT family transporter [Marivibrio halodurans]
MRARVPKFRIEPPTSDHLKRANNLKGMGWMLVAAIAFASMHAGIKQVSHELHPFEIAFFRNFFAVIALLPVLLRVGIAPLRTKRPGLLGLRAATNLVAMLMYFTALSLAPLADVSALGFLAPIFVTLLGALVLREHVGPRRWAAILAGFAGAMVLIRPGFGGFDLGHILVVLSTVVWAVALLVIKLLSRTESSTTITLYMGIMLAPLSLVPALFVWQWPSGEAYIWLAGIGCLGALAQWALSESLRLGETAVVMPVDFFKLIWAAALGYLLFLEVPDLFTWIGGGTIFAAGTYIAVRESRLGRARMRPPDRFPAEPPS